MPTPKRKFYTGEIYHIYNRGVEKREIFLDHSYYLRFFQTLDYYRHKRFIRLSFRLKEIKTLEASKKGELLVKLFGYCLMPNHFHLLIKQNAASGISKYLNDLSNSFARYFNIRNVRTGPLFQSPFKAKPIETWESFLQVSRYIHLNPVELFHLHPSGAIWDFLVNYPYSSLRDYVKREESSLTDLKALNDLDIDLNNYSEFVKGGLSLDLKKIKESLGLLSLD